MSKKGYNFKRKKGGNKKFRKKMNYNTKINGSKGMTYANKIKHKTGGLNAQKISGLCGTLGWNEVGSKNSKMISFNKDGFRLNIYYNTMTVSIQGNGCNNFHKKVTETELILLLKKPRLNKTELKEGINNGDNEVKMDSTDEEKCDKKKMTKEEITENLFWKQYNSCSNNDIICFTDGGCMLSLNRIFWIY